MYVKVYDERTGNPAVDNRNRNKNRALNRACRARFRIETPRGRRRKHVLTRIEYPRFARIVANVADSLRRIADTIEN